MGLKRLLRLKKCHVQREFTQLRHGLRDLFERRALLAVQHHQAFEHQLAQHAQGVATAVGFAKGCKTGAQGRPDRCSGGQCLQRSTIAPSQALHEA